MKIKPRKILELSIVSPFVPTELLLYGRQAEPNCCGHTPALEWACSCKQVIWPIRLRTIRSAPWLSLLITSGIFQGNFRDALKPLVE
jgi:hypothetical protein